MVGTDAGGHGGPQAAPEGPVPWTAGHASRGPDGSAAGRGVKAAAVTTLQLTLSDRDIERLAEAVARLGGPRRGWLTVRGASEYSSLSQEAIRTAHKRGRLKGSKGDSGRLMFRVEDVDAFLGDE